MSVLVTGAFVIAQEKSFKTAFTESTWREWGLMATIAVCNNLGQLLDTHNNQRANPATVGILSYFGISVSFLVDLFIFDIKFTPLEITGSCMCFFFTIGLAVYK